MRRSFSAVVDPTVCLFDLGIVKIAVFVTVDPFVPIERFRSVPLLVVVCGPLVVVVVAFDLVVVVVVPLVVVVVASRHESPDLRVGRATGSLPLLTSLSQPGPC